MNKSKLNIREVVVCDSGKFYKGQWNYIDALWTLRRCNTKGVIVGNPDMTHINDDMMEAYLKVKTVRIVSQEKQP